MIQILKKISRYKILIVTIFIAIAVISIMVPTLIYQAKNKETVGSLHITTHEALSRTTKVGGLMAYDIVFDNILNIPASYFTEKAPDLTYEDLIEEIGEPNGTIGFGIVREYWRIGEKKYAVLMSGTNHLFFTIVDENG